MTNNYLTLIKLTQELQCLVGAKLVECFSQEKDNLILSFYDGMKLAYLQFNALPQTVSLFLRKNYQRAGKNSIDLFKQALGDNVQNIKIVENERIIEFKFLNYFMFFVLFGGSKTNLFLTNKENKIIDAFKNSNKYIGKEFLIQQEKKELSTKEMNLIDWLTKSYNYLGKLYTIELLKKLNLEPTLPFLNLKDEQIYNLKLEVEKFKNDILNSKYFYLYKTTNKYILSLIQLQNIKSIYKTFDSVSQAIESKIINTLKDKQFTELYDKYLSLIKKSLEKVNKNIQKIENAQDLVKNAHKYKLYADLLISQPNLKQKGMKQIALTDWDGIEIIIPLNKEQDLKDNAQNYYTKAKKSKEYLTEIERLKPQLLIKKDWLEKCFDELRNVNNIKQLKEKVSKIKMEANSFEQIDTQSTKFREFNLGEGYILYVGKSAKNNDELTLKFAKPNDLWFHARGAEGSHAVLKINKKGIVPKHIIEKSAQITAYYSKARNSKYVPVCYTYKKYVHKPKGANPGAVVISREEVIMVEPKLN